MYKHILIGTDGSALGTRAVIHGLALAKAVNAKVTLVTVTEPWSAVDMAIEARKQNPNPIKLFEDMAAAQADRILSDAGKKASEAGVAFDSVHVPNRQAAEGIIETAEKKQCDLIVMASHGRRGLERLILGSQ